MNESYVILAKSLIISFWLNYSGWSLLAKCPWQSNVLSDDTGCCWASGWHLCCHCWSWECRRHGKKEQIWPTTTQQKWKHSNPYFPYTSTSMHTDLCCSLILPCIIVLTILMNKTIIFGCYCYLITTIIIVINSRPNFWIYVAFVGASLPNNYNKGGVSFWKKCPRRLGPINNKVHGRQLHRVRMLVGC